MIFYNCEELETKLYKARMINLYLTIALIISLMVNVASAETINCTTFGTQTTCTNGMVINRMALGTNITMPDVVPVVTPMEQIAPAMLVVPIPPIPGIK
jgi:hypothetical protein